MRLRSSGVSVAKVLEESVDRVRGQKFGHG